MAGDEEANRLAVESTLVRRVRVCGVTVWDVVKGRRWRADPCRSCLLGVILAYVLFARPLARIASRSAVSERGQQRQIKKWNNNFTFFFRTCCSPAGVVARKLIAFLSPCLCACVARRATGGGAQG